MLLFIPLFLGACTLNADQEASLNNAMFAYINSRNKGVVMSFVAYTHPDVVNYYKTAGDSIFTGKFDLMQYENPYELNDGNILTINSDGDIIHVQYSFTSLIFGTNEIVNEDFIIFALSDDNGISWSFMEEDDYLNDQIMDPSDRLIK